MMVLLLVLLVASPSLLANRIHSYWREDGVRVLTNLVPPRPERHGLRFRPGHGPGLYQSTVQEISLRYGVDMDLVNAVIRVESNFRPEAVSPKGCLGLMQLHPDTARRFGVHDVFDPVQNIEGGVRYLEFLLDYFQGDLELALAGYNAGENAVIRYGGVPPYPETIDYVEKVRRLYGFASARAPGDRILRVVQPSGRVLLTNLPQSNPY
ncbi:MAG: lytic transglycosylase domain-containing protein [Candidatus Aminicenantes bacterium]|nr:lytic transglycosylase domain-containing protein [Candidatus Aminicenantes bacterium]